MGENLMNSDHKATNEKYRNNYNESFNKKKKGKDNAKRESKHSEK